MPQLKIAAPKKIQKNEYATIESYCTKNFQNNEYATKLSIQNTFHKNNAGICENEVSHSWKLPCQKLFTKMKPGMDECMKYILKCLTG